MRDIDRAMAVIEEGRIEESVEILSAVLQEATATGDLRRAAVASARLGWICQTFTGNRTAAHAWFARAARLIAGEPDCVEHGWVALAGLGCDVDDPDDLAARAERALTCARVFGDVNLEAKALADGGLARVQAGRIAEGMAMLDEANALWCGPAANRGAATMGVCSFFTACYYAADFERAGWWVDDLQRVGILGEGSLGATFITGHCESVQATALIELGRWSEAEALLTRSLQVFETATGTPAWHPAIALADLRTRQGRLAEAEVLLLGKDAHLQALLPSARLHLARGDAALAAAIARRGLRMVGSDRLRGTDLLSIVVEAEVAAGDLAAAADAFREMGTRGRALDEPALATRAARANALVLAASGQLAAAITLVETTVDALESRLPVQRLMLTLDLITLHERAGNRAAAALEAHRATSVLAGLDVGLPPSARAVLDRYADGSGPRSPSSARLYRDGDAWLVASEGVVLRLRATKGVRYLAELLGAPGGEKHAMDLVDRVEGLVDGLDRRRLGDAGEVSDATARSAYRSRMEALRSAIADALEAGEDNRAAALEEECAALTTELLTAFGLGGRGRLVASAAERARLNVTRSVRTTIERISEALPEAGRVLDQRIRTGLYCAYEPEPADAVRWTVQS